MVNYKENATTKKLAKNPSTTNMNHPQLEDIFCKIFVYILTFR